MVIFCHKDTITENITIKNVFSKNSKKKKQKSLILINADQYPFLNGLFL